MSRGISALPIVGIPRHWDAGACLRVGRETLFHLDPKPIAGMQEYQHPVSEQWDRALDRLRAFVEDGEHG